MNYPHTSYAAVKEIQSLCSQSNYDTCLHGSVHPPSRMFTGHRSSTQSYQDNASVNTFGNFHAVVGRKLDGKSMLLRGQHRFDSITSSREVILGRIPYSSVESRIAKASSAALTRTFTVRTSFSADDSLAGKAVPTVQTTFTGKKNPRGGMRQLRGVFDSPERLPRVVMQLPSDYVRNVSNSSVVT
jgi:hypothetical protein